MAVSLIMLEIVGAPGESTATGHERKITVDSFSWSIDAEKSSTDATVKLDAKAVNIKKQVDRSSIRLRKMMYENEAFTATLHFLDSSSRSSSAASGTGKVGPVLKMVLLGCHIDSISFSADDSGKAVSVSEALTISYQTSASLTYYGMDQASKIRSQTAAEACLPAGK